VLGFRHEHVRPESNGACVPFPAPGFPKRTMIMVVEMYGDSGWSGIDSMTSVAPRWATLSAGLLEPLYRRDAEDAEERGGNLERLE